MKTPVPKSWHSIVSLGALALVVAFATTVRNGSALAQSASPPSAAASKAGDATANQTLFLDGKTAFARVPDSPSLQSMTNAITMEVWFKASSFYKREMAVNSILRKNVRAERQNFFLRFREIRGKPAIEMAVENAILSAPYGFQPGRWYHLAGTFGGGRMTAYVNGEAIGSQPVVDQIDLDHSDIVIGKGDPSFSSGEYFHGQLDDIRIWNVARTPEQILAGMNSRLTGKEPGLVAWWNFEDGTGKDASGRGNDAILGGQAKTKSATPPDASAPAEAVEDWEKVEPVQ
jgi:hypothetical protein